jgi:biopolymer transport protein ExbD
MAIQMGSSGRTEVSDINVTPMIDVLLVLLVIFMIVQPLLQKAIDVQLPKEERTQNADQFPRIVLEMAADGTMNINQQPVTASALEAKLREIYTGRDDRVLFIKVADDVVYEKVIKAMDAARGAGIMVLGAVL